MKPQGIPIFAICWFLLCGVCSAQRIQSSTNPEIPLTANETWKISGTEYEVEETAALIMGNGEALLVIKVLVDFVPDQSHQSIARLIAKHAIDERYEDKVVALTWNGKLVEFSGSVGVALVKRTGTGPTAMNYGWRYSFKKSDLIEEKGKANKTVENNSVCAPRIPGSPLSS